MEAKPDSFGYLTAVDVPRVSRNFGRYDLLTFKYIVCYKRYNFAVSHDANFALSKESVKREKGSGRHV